MIEEVIKEKIDPTTKQEIDLMIDMGHELLAYQKGEVSGENFSILKDKLINLQGQSSIRGYDEAFAEFIENNYENGLPNQSSGSFINALTDIDGLLYGLGYEDDKFSEEQHDAAYNYYEEQKAKLRIY